MKKKIAILGSTGSIGAQALEVIASHPEEFQVEVLTAHYQADLLIEQARRFDPNAIVIADESLYSYTKEALRDYPDIKIFAGYQALEEIVEMTTIDMVLMALVGFSGLKPTLKAIEAGKPIALANKETLVVAGDIITRRAYEKGVNIYPVDSEHSAIFQCLVGELNNPIQQLFLTASGGPFFGRSPMEMEKITPEEALNHPNWKMGKKVTIDSATLMNKGLEMIEAHWLFGVGPEKIKVVVHPQSIVHSLVEFTDGSIKAQLGLPDMRLPIQYALSFPQRLHSDFPKFSFANYPTLSFAEPDAKAFRCLPLAYEAIKKGGNLPCILNAANEIAVDAFLHNRLKFNEIPTIIEQAMSQTATISAPSLEDCIATDQEVRNRTLSQIKSSI